MTHPTRQSESASHESGSRVIDRQHDSRGGPGPQIMAADTLQGDQVINSKGEELGKIEEIMIDIPSGRVAYAVLSFGGIMGIGDKLFAIPWSALTLDADRERFVLDIDRDRLKHTPGFDKGHWPAKAELL